MSEPAKTCGHEWELADYAKTVANGHAREKVLEAKMMGLDAQFAEAERQVSQVRRSIRLLRSVIAGAIVRLEETRSLPSTVEALKCALEAV